LKEYKELLGESLGTFILVFFGCGSVAVAVLFNAFSSLLEVALIWGLGVAIAIYTTRNICPAHLNPAVSLAMCISKKLGWKKLPFYILVQFLGAFLAGLLLFVIFENPLQTFEEVHNIVRGSDASIKSAMMFGEYFPNPSFDNFMEVFAALACCMEGLGTFLLVFVILRVTEKPNQINNTTPLVIGLTVTVIICIVAPFTQAGLNPARDFGPRMVAYFAGWGNAAFPKVTYSFLTVYILSPLLGGIVAAYSHKLIKGGN
jgi:glycerol uptake facilitator protein